MSRRPLILNVISHRFLWIDTDKRHIISVKSQGFSQTPQDIMEEYNGCSAPQYTRYPLLEWVDRGAPLITTLIFKPLPPASGMKTRELAIEFAKTLEDDEWSDYQDVADWITNECQKLGINATNTKQSLNLLTVDSDTRTTRGEKWGKEAFKNPASRDIFISNGRINENGKKECQLRKYIPGDTPYVPIS